MKMLQAPNGFKIPTTRWPIQTALGCDGPGDKPRIWWRGKGYYSFKIRGKDAWVWVDVPDPPKEPDSRFSWNREAHAQWNKDWRKYLDEHGIVAAAMGTLTCDMYVQSSVFEKIAVLETLPPESLRERMKLHFDVDPLFYNTVLPMVVTTYNFDMMRYAAKLFGMQREDFNTWNEEVEQSLEEWLTDRYSADAAATFKELNEWTADSQGVERYNDIVRDYNEQLSEAVATLRKLKR